MNPNPLPPSTPPAFSPFSGGERVIVQGECATLPNARRVETQRLTHTLEVSEGRFHTQDFHTYLAADCSCLVNSVADIVPCVECRRLSCKKHVFLCPPCGRQLCLSCGKPVGEQRLCAACAKKHRSRLFWRSILGFFFELSDETST
ncbi:MAG: hypothetical protein HS102_07940 [Planctomycetia bacterium]|nr:hypothetical protein [Planctomycetia bacterium]